MNQLNTTAIVLNRTDFGEADRILTLLTPDYGKLRLMAKGVRKVRSKLAGGIELFSVSHITFIQGRGDIGTLVSTRLDKHYGNIVHNIERTMMGYELIKQLNKVTEDEPEEAYFYLLQQAFAALDDEGVDPHLIKVWFAAQLLKLAGHSPNLQTDERGKRLEVDQTYNFNVDAMTFMPVPSDRHGRYNASHIRLLRLFFSGNAPVALQQVGGVEGPLSTVSQLVQTMLKVHIRTS